MNRVTISICQHAVAGAVLTELVWQLCAGFHDPQLLDA
jgi:hypothetical protein